MPIVILGDSCFFFDQNKAFFMTQDDLLIHQIALTLIPGVGSVLSKNLLSYCGSAEAVFKEKFYLLQKIPGIGPHTAAIIKNSQGRARAEKELEFIRKMNISPLFYMDKNYPNRLKHCVDAPMMLYFKGNANLNDSKVLGIVGTRKATDYGKKICIDLVEQLQGKNILVMSGLAYGIDVCAHKACIKDQLPNVGVLGHGLDRIYPQMHKAIADKMISNGGLITEFLSGTAPDKENFPKRNRILAGMVDALVVVEAARSGGALITADIANSYNRDVFAFPGRTSDVYSEGCNVLIKNNKAVLIQSYADVEYVMGWEAAIEKNRASIQRSLFVDLEGDERKIFDLLQENGELSTDALCLLSSLTPGKLAVNLMGLECKGLVKSLPGNIFRLL